MKSLSHSQIQGAVAIFSFAFLAAIMSSASLVGIDVSGSNSAHSFVGTAPDAASVDVQPPTF